MKSTIIFCFLFYFRNFLREVQPLVFLKIFVELMELIIRLTEKYAIKEDCLRVVVNGIKHSQLLQSLILQKELDILISLLKPTKTVTLKACRMNLRTISLRTLSLRNIMILALTTVNEYCLWELMGCQCMDFHRRSEIRVNV